MRRSKERGSVSTKQVKRLSNKFVGQVDEIFKNLPKPLEWRSFLNHDLPLVIDLCEEVQEASVKNDLNRAQTRALGKLRAASAREPVNYDEMGDAIILLRKQNNSLGKTLEEIPANLSK